MARISRPSLFSLPVALLVSANLLAASRADAGDLGGKQGPRPTGRVEAAEPSGRPAEQAVPAGVVSLWINGQQVGLGAVLSGDGRIVTALSAVGAATDVEVHHTDHSVGIAKVMHRDANVDLALLVPQTQIHRVGFLASELAPSATQLTLTTAATAATAKEAGVNPFEDRGGRPLKFSNVPQTSLPGDTGRTKTGLPLVNVFHFGPAPGAKATESLPGAPVADGAGALVGIAIPACAEQPVATCTKIGTAVGINALRTFLRAAPASARPPAGWLGIVGEAVTGHVYGVRVVAVAPQGPAEKAALALGSDIIVAVDGRPTETPEALGAAIAAHTPSDTVHLLVFGNHSAPGVASGNVYRDVAVELRAAP